MASKIRIMPEQLANQIAAGEVVERPASVVKELVENAVDAGANRIIIEVEAGGRSLIRVTDNGSGMGPDDALLCLERHATSKIMREEDLWRVSSLGFRGEALGAIASVSRLLIAAREKDSLAGVTLKAVGGDVKEVKEAGLPVGTSIEVRDLFFNTPGRRKFLRSAKTEMGHIAEAVIRQALWQPGVYFELKDGEKTVLQVPATDSIPERIGVLLGREAMSHFFHFEKEFPFFSVEGYASNPDYSRSSGKSIFPYVNRRHVRDRILIGSVTNAYAGHLIKGRYPVAVFNIAIDPELVDVNVHPAKAEVRFRKPADVFAGVRNVLGGALAARFGTGKKEGFLAGYGRSTSKPEVKEPLAPASTLAFGETNLVSGQTTAKTLFGEEVRHVPTKLDLEITPDESETEVRRFADLAVIGQLADSYIVCENRTGAGSLLIIDQHAAHERINYEKLRSDMLDGSVEVQNLLLPVALELRPVESEAISKIVDDLARVGVVVASFGPDSWRIEAIPAILSESDARMLVLDCMEQVQETGTAGKPAQRLEAILVTAACHGSVRAGQALTIQQMREILRGLDRCERPMSCPHGRPTVREFPLDEIERAFHRR